MIKKLSFFTYLMMAVAIILGVYGQSISYFISYGMVSISPVYCLLVLTIISILLFIFTPIISYYLIQRYKIKKEIFKIYFIGNSIIGICISIFSILVLIAWLG